MVCSYQVRVLSSLHLREVQAAVLVNQEMPRPTDKFLPTAQPMTKLV